MANKYTTIPKIEAYLLIEIANDFEANVEQWIEAAAEYTDNVTGRSFTVDSEKSERYYDGNGLNYLLIDDAQEIDAVYIGETAVPNDNLLFYPANSLPITKIVYKGWRWPQGLQNIKVSAKWGYGLPPADLVWANTVLVSAIIQRSLNHEGEVASMTVGRYSVSFKDEQHAKDYDRAIEIINSYKRLALAK